ncbi:porin family protein (plasmid) [Pseudochrobactrum algeriensis]|uniref:Outer membrane immunogenic protein n=1 Tax=Pseudochrobactrum saccharolyticum TaxID=354352 RepID=A0A7W8ENH6_9HYPH|nr:MULTISPECIES: outer membrane protein [Pseudochrobactrum]MBX8812439.1 porin family protein [Ochrobactrum sp. MR34]MBB5091485.1 outer membrane immunogenic protein [Pseudochrobactrum saccharolyticum]QVQ35507.1 porin family protein [Pseudochrobactrum algeriensis]QVQ42123.1 porin family protein [Pseudochrobactrum algeriensis]QVQ42381.1 porin family protein [Pseudochrobactrum algeriensis]
MKNKFLLLTAAFFISNINISHAADVVYNSPEAPAYDESSIWGGAYIGGQVGYNWAKTKLYGYNSDLSANSNGFMGGLYAGYNWEFSNAYLFGLEGDINYSDLSKDSDILIGTRNYVWNSRVEWEGALRARFGINYERWLPYVAGGVAFAGIKHNLTTGNTDLGTTSNTNVGFTLGAGVDYALTNNLLLRAEYRYSDYGKKGIDDNDLVEAKLTTNNIRLGIAYKF